MRCIGEEIERMDGALAALARGEAGLRLRLGQALEVVSRGGVFELGFSSLAAYAVERCERSGRWAEVARCMARRLEVLPELRRGVALGQVCWSMAELLARVAQPEDEARWLAMAESRTVRQMRVHVAAALAWQRAVGRGGEAHAGATVFDSGALESGASDAATSEASTSEEGTCKEDMDGVGAADGEAAWGESSGRDDTCTVTCTVDQEEAWLFEATRSLLEQLGVYGAQAQSDALLAEAQGTLQALLPDGTLDPSKWHEAELAQQRWVSELGRWRVEAEALCEMNNGSWLRAPRGHGADVAVTHAAAASAAALGMAALEGLSHERLDGEVRALAEGMARHELELSRLVLGFHRSDGWRQLGYASETQYARERLGASRSSVHARRQLALRLEKLPAVAAALGAGQLGVEAALQVVRVATMATQGAWVARAQRRTIKHLREEVAAALAAVRWSGELDCPPPVGAELEAFQALEQAVVSGRLPPVEAKPAEGGSGTGAGAAERGPNHQARAVSEPLSDQRRAWFVMLASLAAWLEGGLQMSAASSGSARSRAARAGRVVLRLRMSRATAAWWHGLEAQARRWLPRGMSWLRFVCLSVWQTWQHSIKTDVAYGHIYIRDRYRCLSPVCNRRDVTPHHLRFRSAGGSDEPQNIGSFCTWCHLCGVHGGRIRARGTARLIHWELGAPGSPCLVVHGRERVAA